MTDRRGLAIALVAGLAAGGLTLLGAGRPWARAEIVAAGVPRSTVETAGVSAVPWVGALALVVLAGTLALIPTAGRIRRGVGVVILLAAAGVVVGALAAGPALSDAIREDVAESPASGGVDDAAVADAADRLAWRWLSLGGGIAGMATGVLAVARGDRWPAMGSRFDAPVRRRPGRPAAEDAEGADLWRELDEGRDPTA